MKTTEAIFQRAKNFAGLNKSPSILTGAPFTKL